MCPSCRRGVDSGAWAHNRPPHSNRVATTVMPHLAGTTRKAVSCERRERPVVSAGAAAAPVPGKYCCLLLKYTYALINPFAIIF